MAPPQADDSKPYSIFLAGEKEVSDYHWSPDEWPSLAYNEFGEDGVDLPIISLSTFQSPDPGCREQLRQQVLKAAQEWGFFTVVSHDVPLELIKQVQEECLRLFGLPLEQKQKAQRTPVIPLGYSASNPDYGKNLPWLENVQILDSPQRIVNFAHRVWEDEHRQFGDALIKYSECIKKLGLEILELIAEALGLETDHFSQHFTDPDMGLLRINHYLPCPDPVHCLGLGSHSDPQTITLLLQDAVPGLQVVHEGRWIATKPVPGGITVNVGDTLQAWTNKRVKSEEHRAVLNDTYSRLSIASFFNPDKETLITPDSRLVDEEHPECYKPFTMAQFQTELIKQKRVTRKFALDRYKLSHFGAPDYPIK